MVTTEWSSGAIKINFPHYAIFCDKLWTIRGFLSFDIWDQIMLCLEEGSGKVVLCMTEYLAYCWPLTTRGQKHPHHTAVTMKNVSRWEPLIQRISTHKCSLPQIFTKLLFSSGYISSYFALSLSSCFSLSSTYFRYPPFLFRLYDLWTQVSHGFLYYTPPSISVPRCLPIVLWTYCTDRALCSQLYLSYCPQPFSCLSWPFLFVTAALPGVFILLKHLNSPHYSSFWENELRQREIVVGFPQVPVCVPPHPCLHLLSEWRRQPPSDLVFFLPGPLPSCSLLSPLRPCCIDCLLPPVLFCLCS